MWRRKDENGKDLHVRNKQGRKNEQPLWTPGDPLGEGKRGGEWTGGTQRKGVSWWLPGRNGQGGAMGSWWFYTGVSKFVRDRCVLLILKKSSQDVIVPAFVCRCCVVGWERVGLCVCEQKQRLFCGREGSPPLFVKWKLNPRMSSRREKRAECPAKGLLRERRGQEFRRKNVDCLQNVRRETL